MPDPTPLEWLEEHRHRRAAEDLRAAASELRVSTVALADRLVALRAYDRSDVWQGAVADRARLARAEALRRLASPTSGALTALSDAAARLDARAAAHEAAGPTITALPLPCPVLDLLSPPWDREPDCPR